MPRQRMLTHVLPFFLPHTPLFPFWGTTMTATNHEATCRFMTATNNDGQTMTATIYVNDGHNVDYDGHI